MVYQSCYFFKPCKPKDVSHNTRVITVIHKYKCTQCIYINHRYRIFQRNRKTFPEGWAKCVPVLTHQMNNRLSSDSESKYRIPGNDTTSPCTSKWGQTHSLYHRSHHESPWSRPGEKSLPDSCYIPALLVRSLGQAIRFLVPQFHSG